MEIKNALGFTSKTDKFSSPLEPIWNKGMEIKTFSPYYN